MRPPPPKPATDWAHRAARGVLANLSDRRGVRQALEGIDGDIKKELTDSIADIIRLDQEENL